jgi:thiamine-phosphate pyrophosphorylase
MKLILLSPTASVKNEISILNNLFALGLETYHLKKPSYSEKKMKAYLDKIPTEYHNRVVIHSHHLLVKKYNLKGIHLSSKLLKKKFKTWWILKRTKGKKTWLTVSTSFHSVKELDQINPVFDYVFLSPIFDSITNSQYQSGFQEFSLTNNLKNTPYKVIALGGISEEKIHIVQRMGFYGMGLLGALWTSNAPIQIFQNIKNKLNSQILK